MGVELESILGAEFGPQAVVVLKDEVDDALAALADEVELGATAESKEPVEHGVGIRLSGDGLGRPGVGDAGADLGHGPAHTELERICLDRATFNYKRTVSQDFANLIYDGLWFGPLRECLQAFVEESQRSVSGEVRIRVSAGLARITGRRSTYSLYNPSLATYHEGDTFDRETAKGFMELFGMPYKTVAEVRRAVGHPNLKASTKPEKA